MLRPNKRLEKMPTKRQHTGLYDVISAIRKTFVKFNTNLGAHIFHLAKLSGKKITKYSHLCGLFISREAGKFADFIIKEIKHFFSTNTNPFATNIRKINAFLSDVKAEGKKFGFAHGAAFAVKDLLTRFKNSKKKLSTLVNYACPVIAVVFFVSLVSYGSHSKYALSIECNGHIVGYVKQEADYNEAQKMIQDRITYVDGDKEIVIEPKLSVQRLSAGKEVVTANELTDNLINHTDTPVINAYGLYINDKFMGAVTDKSDIEKDLSDRLNAYKTENTEGKVDFVDKIEFKTGMYLQDGIKSEKDIKTLIDSQKQVEAYYTVVEGDSPTYIADKVGMPYSEIKALNPTIEDSLYPGQKILLTKSQPYLSVKVTRTENYDVSIPYSTETVDDSKSLKGTKKVVTEGEEGTSNVTADVTYIDGTETSRTITSQVTTKDPVNKQVSVGTKVITYSKTTSGSNASASAIAASGGGFMWPVGGSGGYISQSYRSGHPAIDIACSSGSPIYASASGTVIAAGWDSTGYGNRVIISHGNGITTLYAHCSSLNVRVGQSVSKGQLIAALGSTGRSTGPHCHFEIRSGNSKLNPSNYVRK